MKKNLILPVVVGALLSFSTTTYADTENEKSVKEAVVQFYKALNILFIGDAKPMAKVWSHSKNITYMGPGGGMLVGWEKVLKEFQMVADLKLGGEIGPTNQHIHMGEDVAIVVNYEKGKNKDHDDKDIVVSIRATNIFHKENGTWKMIGHHTDLLPFLEK